MYKIPFKVGDLCWTGDTFLAISRCYIVLGKQASGLAVFHAGRKQYWSNFTVEDDVIIQRMESDDGPFTDGEQ